MLPTLALVFHSHGRESLHLCFCLDLGLSLGLCAFGRERPTTSATTKGNESHTETPPIVLLLFCWFKSWLGDKDLVFFFFFFFYLGLKGGVWVWTSVDLWVFFFFFGFCLKIDLIWCSCWSMNDYGYVCMLCEFISLCGCVCV